MTTRYLRIVAALLAILALCGCRAGPDLRVSNEPLSMLPFNEGERLLEEGRAVEAVTAFRRRIREEGADLKSLNGLAIAYGELGRSDLAAEMFARALAKAPNDPATLNNIGFLALRRADERLARHYLEKAQRGQDDHEKIEGNLARLAWLEKIKQSRPRAALTLTAMSRKERGSSEIIRLNLPEPHAQLPVTNTSAKNLQPPLLPQSMIDFTAVTDPFSRRRVAE